MSNDNHAIANFKPNGVTVRVSANRKEVRLVFAEDEGRLVDVLLQMSNIPALLAALHAEIHNEKVVPIDQSSLSPGLVIKTESFRIARSATGDKAQLTFFVSLPEHGDRSVTIPLTLSKKEATELVGSLTRHFDLK